MSKAQLFNLDFLVLFLLLFVNQIIFKTFKFNYSKSLEMRKEKNTNWFDAMKKNIFCFHLEHLNGFPLSLVTKYSQGLILLVTKVTQSW